MSNMVVRTNIFALNAHRNMKNTGLEMGRATNRLASGFRINSAADDAAGLAISETMRAQIRGLDQASRNAQDGQAMLLTTEGGLEEIGNMLQRTRELLVQASNDTNTQDQRGMIEQEIRQLGQEIASMQRRVEFNTNRVLDMGPAIASNVSDGIRDRLASSENIAESMRNIDANRTAVAAAQELLGGMEGTATLAGAQLLAAQTALAVVTMGTKGTFGAQGAVYGAKIDAVTVAAQTVSEILTLLNTRNDALDTQTSAIVGGVAAVYADSNALFTAADTHRRATGDGDNVAFFQVGANSSQGITYDFERVARAVTSAAAVVQLIGSQLSMPGAGSGIGNGVAVTGFIDRINDALIGVNEVRANLGAVQNRLDFTMRSLDISSENLQDSESRVRNADIAREMMRFTMTQVLSQAATSMLAQGNQIPQNLLQILR